MEVWLKGSGGLVERKGRFGREGVEVWWRGSGGLVEREWRFG